MMQMKAAMTISVPYLADDEIERAADSLLADFVRKRGDIVGSAVPIDDVAEKHLRLGIEFDDLHARFEVPRPPRARDSDILGALLLDERRIVIDESLDPDADNFQEGRYRFTAAHEVGHWQLHRHLLATDLLQASFLEDAPKPNVVCRTSQRRERIEVQADAFAACLLMPRKLVRSAWKDSFPDDRPRVLKPAKPVRHDFVEVPLFGRDLGCGMTEPADAALNRIAQPFAETFCVSVRAMRIRLEGMGLLHRDPPQQRDLGKGV
jgi:hypothetical protein